MSPILLLLLLPWAVLGTPPLQIPDERLLQGDEPIDVSRFQVPRYRLPITVRPIHYKIFIRPVLKDSTNFEIFTAPGNVTISVQCIEESDTIILHQKNLDIPLAEIQVRHNGSPVEVIADLGDESKDFLVITSVNGKFTVGENYEIFIPFRATINRDSLYGLYLSNYTDPETNEVHTIATTQFAPISAREMFPCFDEPDLKATFEVKVGRLAEGYHSLSNSALRESQIDSENPDWMWDHYEKTAPMSTYLVALIVSDFKPEAAPAGIFDKPVQIWGPSYMMDQNAGVYPAKVAAEVIKYFQEFTGINYMMPKLDSVAIPQFSFGAMENWGLNTYRVEYLLHIPNENTEAERKKVTQVLAHEISHQWYGNLVTCRWWSDIWLNEGFARFLQYRGMTAVSPEFNTDIAIVSDATQLGMIYDAGPNTHAVRNSAESPEEVNTIFDRITYDKGASLLRMMESVLGKETFDASLRHYLNKTQFNTAVQDNLFDSFQLLGGDKLGGYTAREFLDTWTTQPGFPIVRINVGGKNEIFLSQEKFTDNSAVRKESLTDPGSWIIPVRIVSADHVDWVDKSPNVWIPQDTLVLSVTEGIDTTKWIIVNSDVGGYYRVLYDVKLARLIQAQLETSPEAISPGTRSQLLEDYFQFAEAKYVYIESALEFTKYLHKETELVVWAPLLTNIRKLHNKFRAEQASFTTLKAYFEPKVTGALDLIGWRQSANETGADVILRAQLLDFACSFQSSECVAYAKELFAAWVAAPQNRTIIPADIRPVIYCAAVANGDNQTWNQAYELYQAEKFPAAKSQLLKSLACAGTEAVLNNYIQSAMNSTPGLNLLTALRDIAGSSAGRSLVYDFLVSAEGESAVSHDDFASVVSLLAENNKDPSFITTLQEYIKAHEDKLTEEVKSSLNSSVAKVQGNIKWWNEEGNRILNWFLSNS